MGCTGSLLTILTLLQVWSNYEEQPPEEAVLQVAEEKERTTNYKPVFVTEITDDLHFYVQDVETGQYLQLNLWYPSKSGDISYAKC